MPRLHVVPAQGTPFEHPFEGDSLVVGRSSSCDLVIADRFMSRQQARLYREGDELWIEDLGSRNGTMVNGVLIQKSIRVRAGDVIQASGSVITVLEPGMPPPGPPRPRPPSFGENTLFKRASDLLEPKPPPDTTEIEGQEALRRYADRLRLLNEIHEALSRSVEIHELFDLILDRVFAVLGPEEGVIYLKDAQGEYYRAASRTGPGRGDYLYSRTLVEEVAEKGLAALVLDAQTDERFAEAKSILTSGIRSLVAAPLLTGEGSLGMIALNSRAHVRQFSEEDMELLASVASVAALRIRNVALAEEAAQRRILEEELALARRIQVALLPQRLPDTPGYELHGGNIPSRLVSGDYYEVVTRNEGREFVLMVADVSGKGVAASLLTASLEALSAGPIEEGQPPHDVCARVSRRLFARTPPEKYATAFLAVISGDTGALAYANAGHNPALLVRRSGEVETLKATGMPLGLVPGATYEAGTNHLEPGDSLIIYTDGITEAINSDDVEYGEERLIQVCLGHREGKLAQLAAAIDSDLSAFVQGVPYADDRTFILARRAALPPQA